MPVRRPRRPWRAVQLLGAAARALPRQALPRAPRPVRPRRRDAARARRGARRRAGRELRRGCARASRRRGSGSTRGRRRATRRRMRSCAAPSTGSTSPAAATRASAGSRARSPLSPGRVGAAGARRRGALLPLAGRAAGCLSSRSRSSRPRRARTSIRPPTGARWRAFERRFDERAYLERLAAVGFRFLPRSAPGLPAAAARDPRPAGRALRARRARSSELLARPAVAIVGARACSGYGSSVGAQPRARPRGRRSRRRERARARDRRRGASRRARGCRRDGRRARLRHRPRLSGGARRARAPRRRERGLIVSEYAPGVEPAPWRFPARNRIVAGLCAATVVVEARERSGALITADLALEEGREVFAVPGEITASLSRRDERPAQARRVAAHVRARRPRSRSASSRSRSAARARRSSSSCPRAPTRSRRRPGSLRARSRAALVELELAGRVAVLRRRLSSRLPESVLARRSRTAAPGRTARRPGRRRDRRRRRHRLLGGAPARRGRSARARPRRARRRGRRERAQRRLRARRRRRPLRRRARDVRRRAGAAAYWLWTEEKLDRLAELAGDALRRTGSYRLAADEEERDAIRLEYEALREDGIEAEWLDDVPGAAAGKFHGAIAHPRDGSIQPARFVRRARRSRGGGGRRVPRARAGRGRRRARRRPRPRRDRRLRPRPRAPSSPTSIWPTRGPGDRERAARPSALRPPALRARTASTTGSSSPTAGSCSAASATSRSSTSSRTSRRLTPTIQSSLETLPPRARRPRGRR